MLYVKDTGLLLGVKVFSLMPYRLAAIHLLQTTDDNIAVARQKRNEK